MLSLMLGFGIVSRLATGFIAIAPAGRDRCSWGRAARPSRYLLYLGFDGAGVALRSSRRCSAVPGRASCRVRHLVREYFPPREAGTRIGLSSWRRCSACAGG